MSDVDQITKRSLERVSHKLARDPAFIERKLGELVARGAQVRVLEIGFGWGRALLELARRFRDHDVLFYGVDKERHPTTKGDDLREIARDYTTIPEADLARLRPPQIFYYDATSLHFADNGMDLIYSAATIRFIERKADFLEEVCRVLSPGGTALLHLSEPVDYCPYSVALDGEVLTPVASRFVLKYGVELIPLVAYLRLFENESFQFDFKRESTIAVAKQKSDRLMLKLKVNEDLTLPMRELPYRDESGKLEDGARSVYEILPEMYEMLFEEGLLEREQLRTNMRLG